MCNTLIPPWPSPHEHPPASGWPLSQRKHHEPITAHRSAPQNPQCAIFLLPPAPRFPTHPPPANPCPRHLSASELPSPPVGRRRHFGMHGQGWRGVIPRPTAPNRVGLAHRRLTPGVHNQASLNGWPAEETRVFRGGYLERIVIVNCSLDGRSLPHQTGDRLSRTLVLRLSTPTREFPSRSKDKAKSQFKLPTRLILIQDRVHYVTIPDARTVRLGATC